MAASFINLAGSQTRRDCSVFGVPCPLLNGAIISFGNELDAEREERGGKGDEKLNSNGLSASPSNFFPQRR